MNDDYGNICISHGEEQKYLYLFIQKKNTMKIRPWIVRTATVMTTMTF